MHEVVFSDAFQKKNGINTMDIAKRLIDYGFHPYTTAFPLIVSGALMIEPTESESKEECDLFIDAMRSIAQEAAENPELVKTAPHSTRVRRLDEVAAARRPILRWDPSPQFISRHSPMAASPPFGFILLDCFEAVYPDLVGFHH
jgi:glycine dehydrogenase subunit 2